ncbi:uncharacterized protein LOC116170879 [Photinus pyralis]|uniref:uncharacterized protein LOC116170879 n=1 Tax=Photinus pyralis TaxID=7054 RepID=UPI0012676044|nr:uncharacterized protein LOC116170879 [Photinus pyralis]
MKLHWLLLLVVYAQNFKYAVNKSVASILFQKSLVIDRFMGKCPRHANLPMYLENIHLYPTNGTYNISAKIVVTRDLLSDLKLVLQLERCKAKEDLDSCEPYQNVSRNSLCELAKAKKQTWTPYMTNMQPAISCPPLKGTYYCSHTVFDATPLMMLPISGWYWKVKSLIYEAKTNNPPVMCIYITGQFK